MEVLTDPTVYPHITEALTVAHRITDEIFEERGYMPPPVVVAGGAVRDIVYNHVLARDYKKPIITNVVVPGDGVPVATNDIDVFLLGTGNWHISQESITSVVSKYMDEVSTADDREKWVEYASGSFLIAEGHTTFNPPIPTQLMISLFRSPEQLVDNFDFDINRGYIMFTPSRDKLLLRHRLDAGDWISLAAGARRVKYHPCNHLDGEKAQERAAKFAARFGFKFDPIPDYKDSGSI